MLWAKACLYIHINLTIIPRARMGFESIARKAEERMGYWLRDHEGERYNCFSKIQLVGQNWISRQNNFSYSLRQKSSGHFNQTLFFPFSCSPRPSQSCFVVYRGLVTKSCTPTLRGQGDPKVSQPFWLRLGFWGIFGMWLFVGSSDGKSLGRYMHVSEPFFRENQ